MSVVILLSFNDIYQLPILTWDLSMVSRKLRASRRYVWLCVPLVCKWKPRCSGFSSLLAALLLFLHRRCTKWIVTLRHLDCQLWKYYRVKISFLRTHKYLPSRPSITFRWASHQSCDGQPSIGRAEALCIFGRVCLYCVRTEICQITLAQRG